jgi:hypothetical protein
MAKWKIDAGNSSTGPVGFVVYGIIADTKEAALAKVRDCDNYTIPEFIEEHGDEDDAGNRPTICVYFNPLALTLDNIEEDDSDDEGVI